MKKSELKLKSSLKKGEKSTATITATITPEQLALFKDTALEVVGKRVKVDGFRKGKIPEKILVKQVGELAIIDEMARQAIAKNFGSLVKEHKLNALGQPKISITKLAPGNDVEFTAEVALMPELNYPDYKKIAKAENKKKVDDKATKEDFDEAVLNLRRMRAQAKIDHERAEKAKESGEKFTPTPLSEIDDKDLPEMDAEYAKNLGFETIKDFEEKLKENLDAEKARMEADKKRAAILDTILEKTTGDVPDLLVDYEIQRMLSELKHNIEAGGMSWEDYMKTIDKPAKEFVDDMRPDAERKTRMQLLMNHIAAQEAIKPDPEVIKAHLEAAVARHGDQVDQETAKAYFTMITLNQMVMEFLEAQK